MPAITSICLSQSCFPRRVLPRKIHPEMCQSPGFCVRPLTQIDGI
jgi:hypothetical protein